MLGLVLVSEVSVRGSVSVGISVNIRVNVSVRERTARYSFAG